MIYWHGLFSLAYKSKGVVINLRRVPEDILDRMVLWNNEFVVAEEKPTR